MVKLCVKTLSKKLISLENDKKTEKFFSNQKIEKFILDILSILFPLRGFREELNVNNLSFFIEKRGWFL